MGRGLLVRFAVGALVGVMAAVALGLVFRQKIPSTAGAGTPVSLTDPSGAPIDLSLVDSEATPVDPLPVTSTIQLTAFHNEGATPGPDGLPTEQWWKNGVPRIDHITQFDGGPLQRVNCLMAAAAMLARLGYGVVTTGSQLRALSGDTDGGTAYSNVQDAIRKGWGIRFFEGAITPVQLRALLWAGAGAIIHGVYGKLPQNIRVQASFTGRHAMYVDAFRPAGPDGPAAYWVMDPIGKPWSGYNGRWWPAEAVERMIVELPGGRLGAMWAFPGGKAPANRPQLPPNAYPSRAPNATPDPSEPVDPFPVDPLPLPPGEGESGEETGVDPESAEIIVTEGGATVYPGTSQCIIEKRDFCPRGIVGIIDLDGFRPPPTRPPRGFDILFGGALGAGMYQIIFEPPPDTTHAELWFFGPDGVLREAKVEEGTLDDKTVSIGTIIVDPAIDYQFVATAEGNGVREISTVGSVEVKR
jgi:hypothetical protein